MPKNVSAASICLANAGGDRALLERAADRPIAPASTAKLLTALHKRFVKKTIVM